MSLHMHSGITCHLLNWCEKITRRVKRDHILRLFDYVGKNVSFDPAYVFVTPETTRLGDNVFVGNDAHLSGEITIGDNCMFGSGLTLIAENHHFGVRGRSVRSLRPRSTENEVWGGARVTILGGVTVGMGAVLGAGSVVTRNVPPYVVAAGSPCRPIKRIFSHDVPALHLKELGMGKPAGGSRVLAPGRYFDADGFAVDSIRRSN